MLIKVNAGCHPQENHQGSVAILTYDAGETFGMLPVGKRLAEKGVKVIWMPLTPWSMQVLEREGQSYLQLPEVPDEAPYLNTRDGEGEIVYWLDKLAKDKPQMVISGLVSKIQEQLLIALEENDFPTRGFYDAFDKVKSSSIVLRVATKADELWVPTSDVKLYLEELGMPSVRVFGQPSVESWYRLMRTVDRQQILATQGDWRKESGCCVCRPVWRWI